jgi:hypothetical protein
MKPEHEIVSHCDCCVNPLGCHVQRTAGSATCASIHGIFTKKIEGKWLFFCKQPCVTKYEENPIDHTAVAHPYHWTTATRPNSTPP